MLIFGHIASAALPARWATPKADLRWVIFLALLADLIDKPVGLVIFRETINNGRVYFHSLLVNLLLTLVLIALRKPLIYPLALWTHQLCDRMWMRPWTAMWPFTGTFGYRDLPLDDWVYNVLNPYNLTNASKPSRTISGTSTKAASGSAQLQPNQALSTSPDKVVKDNHAQAIVS